MKLLTYYTGLILSILVFQFSFSQTTIEGKVTDQNNQPLFGANIVIQNTYSGTTTDEEGNFTLQTSTALPLTLEVSYIGFGTQSIKVENDEQNEAFLNFIGQKTEVSWIDHNGTAQKINYHVPNNNQCKNCHINGKEITPIGPTAAQLNGKFKTLSEDITQLEFFAQHNRLEGLPPNQLIPQFAVWDDPHTGSLEERAKAYLDINCAHCHQPKGSAKNSGLDLRFTQIDLRKRGVFKPPVAAGKGSGNLEYSIVPGHPEQSILLYRIDNTEPGIMMPEIGRSINHNEGVDLISEYIKNLTLVGSD